MIKHHLEELKEGVVKTKKINLIGKTSVAKMQFTISLKISLFLLFRATKKGKQLKFQGNFTKKRGKFTLYCKFLIHLLHCTPIVHKTHKKPFFQIYIFIAPRRSQKTTINVFTFVTGVEPTSWCLLRLWYMCLGTQILIRTI